jgi:hypothetical protein
MTVAPITRLFVFVAGGRWIGPKRIPSQPKPLPPWRPARAIPSRDFNESRRRQIREFLRQTQSAREAMRTEARMMLRAA